MFVLGEGLHKTLDIRTVLAHATYVSKNDTEKKYSLNSLTVPK
jgi:hypothetical protein